MSSRETLDTFRRTHHIRQTTVAGNQWFWYTGGVGSQTIVILPGAGAFAALGAEVMFPVIAGLEQQFRVISFGYPSEVATVRELVEGIHQVLAEQQVQQASFLGHSLGSLMTLCFLSTYPQHVTSVVIANFALPSPSHMRSLKTALSLIVRLPGWVTSRVVKSQFCFSQLIPSTLLPALWRPAPSLGYMPDRQTQQRTRAIQHPTLAV
jgi:pimeloyl-ACP methyl ester carboxylesterase